MNITESWLGNSFLTQGTFPDSLNLFTSWASLSESLPLIGVEGVAACFAGPDEGFRAGEGMFHAIKS